MSEGNIRTVMFRKEFVGRHTLERRQICARRYHTARFLEHVKHVDEKHPEKKAVHRHCPTCNKLYYRRNLIITEPKLAKMYADKAID